MEDFVPILSAPEQRGELPPDLQDNALGPIWCRSASELEALLAGGYAAWQKYLNQVLKPQRSITRHTKQLGIGHTSLYKELTEKII